MYIEHQSCYRKSCPSYSKYHHSCVLSYPLYRKCINNLKENDKNNGYDKYCEYFKEKYCR